MADEAWRALRAQLGPRIPDGLRALDDKQLRDLSAAITETRRRQAQALSESGDRAFALVPRLLRGPIRRVIG